MKFVSSLGGEKCLGNLPPDGAELPPHREGDEAQKASQNQEYTIVLNVMILSKTFSQFVKLFANLVEGLVFLNFDVSL